jgi:hypothetical protein
MIERVDVHTCTCLRTISPFQVDRLISLSEEMLVPPGHAFFEEGDLLSSLYLLLLGSVSLNRMWPAPVKTFVRSIGPGEFFGWSALKTPYRATAGTRAMTACQVLAFSRDSLVFAGLRLEGWWQKVGQGETAVSDEHIRHFPVAAWAQLVSEEVS